MSTAYDDSVTGGWLCTTSLTRLAFKLRYADASTYLELALQLSANEWHHVSCDYDGSTMRAFIDGHLVGSRSVSSTTDGSQQLLVLHRNKFNSGAIMNYAVREIRIGNQSLRHEDFSPAWLVDAAPGTVGLWHMTENSGTTLASAIPNGASISLAGSTAWNSYGATCVP